MLCGIRANNNTISPQEMLPEYIHMHVAESILFAGKAVRVLRNPTCSFRGHESIFQQHILRGSQRVQGSISTFVPPIDPLNGTKRIAEELFPQSEADKIEEMLQGLKCFLEGSRQLMRLPPRQSTAEADLMVPFQLERRGKGLCYNCDERYYAGHRCIKPRLFILEGIEATKLEEEEKDGEEKLEEYYEAAEGPEETRDSIGISLHAITGSPDPDTMRLQARSFATNTRWELFS